jgi:AraC family transcriptional regulator
MYGFHSPIDQMSPSPVDICCVPLNQAQASPGACDAKLKVFIVGGPCVIQRYMAGQWIEMRTLFRGGIVMADAAHRTRVKDAESATGVVLLISQAEANDSFPRLIESLSMASHAFLKTDPVIDSLIKVLATAASGNAPCVEEPVLRAVAFRLAVLSNREAPTNAAKTSALPLWRLQRVADFIKQRLDGEVQLADMAAAAGLSPMHFAAQFKNATGMRPHHYLLAERVDRAKQLLQGTSYSIMDIAIAVGFQSQAHFTTVFKRHENTTPHQWRQSRGHIADQAQRVSHRTRGGASQPMLQAADVR